MSDRHYLSRSFSPEVIKLMIEDFLDNNLKMTDISHKYEADYNDLRGIFRREFKTKHLLRYRNVHRRGIKNLEKVKAKSKQIDIVLCLLFESELSYADIARKIQVSRERVGQIAEMIANKGFSVARGSKITRGIAA